MNKTLLVIYHETEPQLFLLGDSPAVSIADIDSDAVNQHLTEITDPATIATGDYPVIGIISAAQASSFIRTVPAKQKKYLPKTLPYLLEDDLIAPLESQHIPSQLLKGNQVRAIAINRDVVQQCINQAESLNIVLDKLYLDADLLNVDSEAKKTATIKFKDRQLIKTPEGLVASIPLDMPTEQIQVDMQNGTPESDDTKLFTQAAKAAQQNYSGSLAPINLLDGEFIEGAQLATRAALVNKLAITFAVLLFVQCLYWAMMGTEYKRTAADLALQSAQAYRDYFPKDKTIIDIRSQAQGHLNQSSSVGPTSGLLLLLRPLGTAMHGEAGIESNHQPDSSKPPMLLKSIRYQRQTNALTVEISAANLAAIERVRQRFNQNNNQKLVATTEQVNRNPQARSGVTATLRIMAGSKGSRQ